MGFPGKIETVPVRAIRYLINVIFETARKVVPEPIKKIGRSILRLGEKPIIARNQETLRQILKQVDPDKTCRAIVIFAPSLDWDVQLFQRPQQLALALAKQGALVFYIQPKPNRNLEPFLKIINRLYLCNVHVDTFQVLPSPLVYLLTWNSDYASCFRNPRILYDFVDDINVFYGDHEKIVKGHQYLLMKADLVLATAHKLVEEASLHRQDILYAPNGVVYEHFSDHTEDHNDPPPQDLQAILANHNPVIGYYGALARWFDFDLLKTIAFLRPNYQFVLIGPDYDGTLEPANILNIPNIHWLGVKTYAELPSYLNYFDVATIPFIVNEITHATSPLKLFEYMAGGKPVVITPMRESMQYEGVLVGESADEFAARLDQALLLQNDDGYIKSLKCLAQHNTWESRADDILCRIEIPLIQ